MATVFIEYQQMILRAYERKKANNMLPHGLMHLTPANLKEECLKRCTTEVSRQDEKVIRDFCVDLKEAKNCHAIIQRCGTDKFRPVVNYLIGKSGKTDEKNIELLAWLIDFPGRPWELGKTITGEEGIKEGQVLDNTSPATGIPAARFGFLTMPPAADGDKPGGNPVIPEIPINPPSVEDIPEKEGEGVKVIESSNQKQINRKSAKTLTAAVMLSLVLGTGGMWWWKDKLGSGGCMYWHEDHYEPVACDQKIPYTTVIALDAERLKHFRKITRPDTITYDAVGKVWYSKIKGKMEYYTWAGEHPEVSGYQLKPITPYIIGIHIHPTVGTNQ